MRVLFKSEQKAIVRSDDKGVSLRAGLDPGSVLRKIHLGKTQRC